MTEQAGHRVSTQRGWEYLRRLRFSKRMLRLCHVKADPQAQNAFKKLSLDVEQIQRSMVI
ncbi:winged helix-turn-helix domain-containing protein [Dictyobacter formicarum]|uniref:winged helix-turn-helix domain-containing protein n=1 Tax=Dictyobacter formicarum TaxID=2778368 RepID=UPI00191538C6